MCCPDAIGVWNTDVAIHPRATAILTYCSTHFFAAKLFWVCVKYKPIDTHKMISILVSDIKVYFYKQEMVLVGTEQDFMLFMEDYVETLI